MTYLWAKALPIAVEANASGQPLSLTWRGQTHCVAEVANHWRINEGWWRGDEHAHRDYWKICTDTGMLMEIYRDMIRGGWYLQRLYD